METKQTAVDFLLHEISDIIGRIELDAFNTSLMKIKYEQAKALEKEQIKNAYREGYCSDRWDIETSSDIQYYKENYSK